jgi:phosphohistidine phosphatase
MELLIVRHAIAQERDRRRWRNDRDRPLSPDGKRQARKAAAGLRAFCAAPDRLLSSSLVRARQTADILTQYAGWPPAEETPALMPGAPVSELLRLLATDRSRRVGLVGHQPDLGSLISYCLTGNGGRITFDLKKPAVASVSFAGAPRAGTGTLDWLATPRMLRAMR